MLKVQRLAKIDSNDSFTIDQTINTQRALQAIKIKNPK
jgi:hypothetical protein